jgi:acylphosphatase
MTKNKPSIRVRLRIEGRVQGVGFRAFVEREAVSRGIAGWVRIAGTGEWRPYCLATRTRSTRSLIAAAQGLVEVVPTW